MYIDTIWLFAWFIVGTRTFQVYGIKSQMETASSLFSILSLLLLLQESNQIVMFINSIGSDLMTGLFTHLTYLIGANISRYQKFGKMSPKIIQYILIYAFFWSYLSW